MIDKDILNELLREAFQDFDLLDYAYYIKVLNTGVVQTNKNGSIKVSGKGSVLYPDYISLYKGIASRNDSVTYKETIRIYFSFKPVGSASHSLGESIINKVEFDEFFLDGMIKLNYFLKEYNIEIPIEKIEVNRLEKSFTGSLGILGDNKEILVEFSSRLKV